MLIVCLVWAQVFWCWLTVITHSLSSHTLGWSRLDGWIISSSASRSSNWAFPASLKWYRQNIKWVLPSSSFLDFFTHICVWIISFWILCSVWVITQFPRTYSEGANHVLRALLESWWVTFHIAHEFVWSVSMLFSWFHLFAASLPNQLSLFSCVLEFQLICVLICYHILLWNGIFNSCCYPIPSKAIFSHHDQRVMTPCIQCQPYWDMLVAFWSHCFLWPLGYQNNRRLHTPDQGPPSSQL